MRQNMREQPDPNVRPNPGRLSAKESQEVLDIMMDYFTKETGSKKEAEKYVISVANLIKNPAAKLVHLGNFVFLTLVKEPGVVEFHTMARNASASDMAKKLIELTDYLKRLGARKIYSYATDPKYKTVTKKSRLPWIITEQQGADGKTYQVYTLEIA